MIGQRFGRLVILSLFPREKGKMLRCECQCDCGNRRACVVADLKRGHTKSCGCLQRERASVAVKAARTDHGLSKTPEYHSWANMRGRCHRPHNPRYADYGGRGIQVCERWRNSFPAFLEDMGKKPDPRATLERIDNSRGYGPDNCRWASYAEQANNARSNRFITFNGETLTLAQWSARTGLRGSMLWGRLRRGWAIEDALTCPADITKKYRYHIHPQQAR